MAADLDMSVDSNDLAIKGYDPVAYFDSKGPVKARQSSQLRTKDQCTIYQFAWAVKTETNSANPQTMRLSTVVTAPLVIVAMGKKFRQTLWLGK